MVKDAILDGEIPNDHDAAWDYLVEHMHDSAVDPKEPETHNKG